MRDFQEVKSKHILQECLLNFQNYILSVWKKFSQSRVSTSTSTKRSHPVCLILCQDKLYFGLWFWMFRDAGPGTFVTHSFINIFWGGSTFGSPPVSRLDFTIHVLNRIDFQDSVLAPSSGIIPFTHFQKKLLWWLKKKKKSENSRACDTQPPRQNDLNLTSYKSIAMLFSFYFHCTMFGICCYPVKKGRHSLPDT